MSTFLAINSINIFCNFFPDYVILYGEENMIFLLNMGINESSETVIAESTGFF